MPRLLVRLLLRVRLGSMVLLLAALATPAWAKPCENCFAVVVMPDTQDYVRDVFQPAGASHMDLITRFVCANKGTWIEWSTRKRMRLAMVVHLGDIVQTGRSEEEWQRASAAFDNLDACGVPYVTALGNHDSDTGTYHGTAEYFNRYFGPQRWDPYRCEDPKDCNWEAGEWFIGSGDPILAFSRNNADGAPGPVVDEPGRHRAAVIRAPNGQRFLFIGLDLAFDFPPKAHPAERDDLHWVKRTMRDYRGVHTILIHHALFGSNGDFRPENFDSDSFTSTEAIWNELVDPFPQVLMTLNGHYLGDRENEWAKTTASGAEVFSVFRNYQAGDHSYGDGGLASQHDGWTPIIVFDPDAGQIRIRSYRIEDLDDDATHDGTPEWPRLVDFDWSGRGERVFPYTFSDARPAILDNCPTIPNPDQDDPDGDGIGNACTPIPALGLGWRALAVVIVAGLGAVVLRRASLGR